MRILAIDTSSVCCSCAIVEDGVLLYEEFQNNGLTHSVTLQGVVKKTLEKAKVSLDTIDFFAVSEGPGSYTGLRIGMAELKGLAFACNKKCILVSTLLSLAQNVIDYNGYVVCALDARVNQFYAAIFKIKDKVITRITEDEALKLEELEKLVPQNALAVGDGAKLLISKLPEKHLKIASDDKIYQRASGVAFLAKKENAVDVGEIKPDYHRKSQAEREREEKQK